jgi:hypothetical protein
MSIHDMTGMNSIWGTSRQFLGGISRKTTAVDVGTTSIDNKLSAHVRCFQVSLQQ